MKPVLGRALAGSAALVLSVSVLVLAADASASARQTAERTQARAADKAGSAVTLGSTSSVPLSCPAGSTTVQYDDSDGPSYTVPAEGVITSFSYYANNAGQVRAVLMGPSATPDHRTLVGSSSLESVTLGSLQTFPVRIAAPAGATLGVFNSLNDMGCKGVAPSGDVVVTGLFDPGTQTDFSGASDINYVANISAVWEPDADHDGYGDVSQDGCPQQASTQAPCPGTSTGPGAKPDTTVTKQPKKKSTKRKVKIKFTSVPGATFTCRLDKKPAKACTSPFKAKLKPGKHKVLITATSPAGAVEAEPAKVKFKILRA
jgi:hypothetical protein